MQDHEKEPALDRRTLLVGVGAISVTAAATGCGGQDRSTADAGAPLGPAGEVPVGAGTVYAERQVVVTQPTQGTFHAFTAVCTHQGCTVADVSDGTINCRCHGSRFDLGSGSVVRGPAQQPLRRLEVAVDAGLVRLR